MKQKGSSAKAKKPAAGAAKKKGKKGVVYVRIGGYLVAVKR
jgi:hypothetical protein